MVYFTNISMEMGSARARHCLLHMCCYKMVHDEVPTSWILLDDDNGDSH